MEIVVENSAAAVMAEVSDFLQREEALNNVPLGVLERARAQPDFYRSFVSYTAISEGRVIAYAHSTPPFPMSLAKGEDKGVAGIAQFLMDNRINVEKIMGPESSMNVFLKTFDPDQDKVLKTEKRGCYRLTQVIEPADTKSQMVLAGDEKLELLIKWYRAFAIAVEMELDSDEGIANFLRMKINAGDMYLLIHDGVPVTCAVAGRIMPNGRSIGFVYTPEEYRRRGFASSMVAELSKAILNQGFAYVCLFTEMQNATSNKIYQAIGYKWVDGFTQVTCRMALYD